MQSCFQIIHKFFGKFFIYLENSVFGFLHFSKFILQCRTLKSSLQEKSCVLNAASAQACPRKTANGLPGFLNFPLTRTVVRYTMEIEQTFYFIVRPHGRRQRRSSHDWLDSVFPRNRRGGAHRPALPGDRRHRAPQTDPVIGFHGCSGKADHPHRRRQV